MQLSPAQHRRVHRTQALQRCALIAATAAEIYYRAEIVSVSVSWQAAHASLRRRGAVRLSRSISTSRLVLALFKHFSQHSASFCDIIVSYPFLQPETPRK